MRVVAFVLVAVCLASPAAAQQSLVESVKAQFEAQGVSLSGQCGAFKITNRVATLGGWKLLRKVSPQNRAVPRPDGTCNNPDQTTDGGFAVGYLIDLRTGYGYDLLRDDGNENGPVWQEETTEVARNMSNWAEPLANYPSTAPPPPPPPTGTGGTVPLPPGTGAGGFDSDALQRQMRIENQLLIAQLKLDALKEQLRLHDEDPSWLAKVFGNRYVQLGLAMVTTYLTTNHLVN